MAREPYEQFTVTAPGCGRVPGFDRKEKHTSLRAALKSAAKLSKKCGLARIKGPTKRVYADQGYVGIRQQMFDSVPLATCVGARKRRPGGGFFSKRTKIAECDLTPSGKQALTLGRARKRKRRSRR